MMVMRPAGNVHKSPTTSRGSSPGRRKTNGNQKSRGSSPGESFRSPGRRNNIRGTRGTSPGDKNGTLPQSRGSESSNDRLDQSVGQMTARRPILETEDNINVCVRVRPLNTKEVKHGDESIVQFPGNGQILLDPRGTGQKHRLFSYNVVFEPGATQDDVFQYSGVKRLLEMAVEGFSCTAFCYGQTGSGKTHTLTGPPGLFDRNTDPYSDLHGLVFKSFMYLFQLIKERSAHHFILKASFLEIYNEKVIDLLNPGSARKPLAVRWSKKSRGFFVENLFTVDCEELDDLLAVLEEGMRNRSVGSHSMNDYSSRSHTILTVHITSEQQMGEDGVFISKQGKINFVDLAGSEMTKKTHSEGKTLEEANNINKSLMVLGYCIASLSDSKKKGGHIPYRDSKLTKLLADSLAGNGVTLMIACISPARSNISETINTLRYAARAKKIRTKPIVVMDPREALILSLKREVNALQNENEHLRTALNLHGDMPPPGSGNSDMGVSTIPLAGRLVLKTPPQVDLDKLGEMEITELSELVKHYLTENEALRKENSELFSTRELLLRDQELVCRENERLLKKLEDVNSVCCRSPIIPARPTYSAEMLNMSMNGNDLDIGASTNVWTNPLNGSITSVMSQSGNNGLPGPKFKQDILDGRLSTKPPHRLPDSIQKEMDKRGIGSSMTNIADSYRERSHRRHNSWDNGKTGGSTGSADSSSSTRSKKRNSDLVEDKQQDKIVSQHEDSTLLINTNIANSISQPDKSPNKTNNIEKHPSLNISSAASSVFESFENVDSQSDEDVQADSTNTVNEMPERKALNEQNNDNIVKSIDNSVEKPEGLDNQNYEFRSVSSDFLLGPRVGPYPDDEMPSSSPSSLYPNHRNQNNNIGSANTREGSAILDHFGSVVSIRDIAEFSVTSENMSG